MNRMATLPPPTLPDDLIVNILSRLRVRSLMLSKCVCKSWLSLISDPQFVKSHSDLAEATPTHLLLKSSNSSQFNCIDIEVSLHDNGDSAEVIFNIPPPAAASEPVSRVDIVGSFRGFILLAYVYTDFFYFVIWNPSTGFHKRIDNVSSTCDYVERLFRIGHDNFALLFGIGYDSSTDDYVVVIVTVSLPLRITSRRWSTKFFCFYLRTNLWSFTDATAPHYIGMQSSPGVLVNGALHWLVVKSDGNRRVVIAFDVTERILSEFSVPESIANGLDYTTYHLMVMRGFLCICFMSFRTVLWTMKDYKVKSSWTKSFVMSTSYCPVRYPFFPICYRKNGQILGSNGPNALVRLNNKGELLESRTFGPEIDSFPLPKMDRFGLLQCGVFRENLLSLPLEDSKKPSEDEQQI